MAAADALLVVPEDADGARAGDVLRQGLGRGLLLALASTAVGLAAAAADFALECWQEHAATTKAAPKARTRAATKARARKR